MSDLISRQDTIDRINEYIEEYSEIDSDGNHSEKWCAMQEAKMTIESMPSAQPETAKRIVGKSRDGMTLWYQCDMCNEPVDVQDSFCRGCGRRLIDERSDWQTGGD